MEKQINTILEKHANESRDSLIPILQEVQEELGFLSEDAIVRISKHLKLPASKIYGVATFYNQFRFQPQGKYHIEVCRGTACHVLGSKTVLEELEKLLKIKSGNTSKNGLFSLEIVACIGACGLAPVITVNGEFYAKVKSDKLSEIIETIRKNESNNE